MDKITFLNSLNKLLESVVSGSTIYTELQKFVDNLIIEDELPEDLPQQTRNFIYEIQMELELIAVIQSERHNSQRYLCTSEISDKLKKYVGKLV